MCFAALNIFSKDVDSLDNPAVQELKRILEEIGKTYQCTLTDFTVEHGVVTFQFDNDEITFDILEDLKDVTGVQAVAYNSNKIRCDKIMGMLKQSRSSG